MQHVVCVAGEDVVTDQADEAIVVNNRFESQNDYVAMDLHHVSWILMNEDT